MQEKSRRRSERLKETEALLGTKEKQLRNLLEAFKRQMELIHVLRQQKVWDSSLYYYDNAAESFLLVQGDTSKR